MSYGPASPNGASPLSHEATPAAPPVLSSAQRKYLRGLAHPLKPLVMVGDAGLSPAVLRALDAALEDHELVKVRLRQPEDKKAAADELSRSSGAALCGVVGHTVILYRPNPDEPEIELPGVPSGD